MTNTMLSGWGRFPKKKSEVCKPLNAEDCASAAKSVQPITPRGLGRSYGDSSLGNRVVESRYLNRFIEFEPRTGKLTCESGVSLSEILRVFVPKGWFLPVTPGTRFVTIGGAIASDVHGKNHHIHGSFSEHVDNITLLLGSGETITVSRDHHPDLFYATAGGMGLTGMILAATMRLTPIKSSNIIERTIKAPNLEAAFDAFESHADSTYRVAWLDCVARGAHFGRSLISLGEHAEEGPLTTSERKGLILPFDLPANLLNRTSVKLFNAMYYRRVIRSDHSCVKPFEPYFYPLDSIRDWNRMYGKNGFVQYQFVLPKEEARYGMKTILGRITESGRASFLAVLKLLGRANSSPLSFPLKGYTLALDFKVHPEVFRMLDELDKVVLDHGGRVYLTKDARMDEATFKAGYPNWNQFQEVRAQYGAMGQFGSDQANRLGLS